MITKVANDRLMLGRDNMSILIDSEGQPTQKNPINWTGIPTQIGTYQHRLFHVNIHTLIEILHA